MRCAHRAVVRLPAAILIAVLSVALAACDGNDEPQASSPTRASDAPSPTTSSTLTVETWRYVAMGDSTHRDVATEFAAIIEDETGVEVDLIEWINPDLATYDVGGERASDLVTRLQTDEDLRSDLREADVITFVIPLGLLIDLCPFDPVTYQPSGTRAQSRACWPEVVSEYTAE